MRCLSMNCAWLNNSVDGTAVLDRLFDNNRNEKSCTFDIDVPEENGVRAEPIREIRENPYVLDTGTEDDDKHRLTRFITGLAEEAIVPLAMEGIISERAASDTINFIVGHAALLFSWKASRRQSPRQPIPAIGSS